MTDRSLAGSIVYAWARLDAGRVLGSHVDPDDMPDILPRVAFLTAEQARDAAEAAYRDDWGGPAACPPLAWAEDNERSDGRYPSFSASPTDLIVVRVYPIEIMCTEEGDQVDG